MVTCSMKTHFSYCKWSKNWSGETGNEASTRILHFSNTDMKYNFYISAINVL